MTGSVLMGLVYTNTYFIAKVEGNPHPKKFIHVGDHPNMKAKRMKYVTLIISVGRAAA